MDVGQDISIVYYTCNHIPESFAKKVRDTLVKTSGGIPIVSVSHKPIDLGRNICIGDVGVHVLNLYKQVLIGAKVADTKYVALCEDDCLYAPNHFTDYRPKDDVFGYNMNKWSVYAWHENPLFSLKANRCVLSQLIAPRELLIEALEERFAKEYTEERIQKHFAEPGRYEKWLQVTIRTKEEFSGSQPNIIICHSYGLDWSKLGRRKAMGDEKKKKLDFWGAPEDILSTYMGETEWIRQQRS